MADPDRRELNAQKKRLEAQAAESRAACASIDEQIGRLNDAKKKVAPLDEGVNAVRNRYLADVPVDRWKGYRRGTYDAFAIHEVNQLVRTYETGASDLFDHICDQITALENQRHENDGVLGWLAQQINEVQNGLEKLVN